ncbi:carbohydrate phosphatase [Nemania serpens]|nr:carbohydrate phosphatase [Nemania serpens]
MDDGPYAHELQVAIRAVQAAARISQSVLASDDKGTVQKDDLSPVTVADFAVQALLAASVRSAFPADGLVGEESAAELRASPALLRRVWDLLVLLRDDVAELCKLPASPEETCEIIDECGRGEPGPGRVWVFDPIDGTKTFVRREAYAINVALLEGGRQVLSVVGCPTLSADADAYADGPIDNSTVDPSGRGSIVFAVRGQGTYIRPLVDDDDAAPGEAPVRARKISPHAESATIADLRAVSCYHMVDSGVDEAHKAVAARLGIASSSSSEEGGEGGCDLLSWVLRWVTLGLGIANVTVWVYKSRQRTGKIWDHAGAMLLFEEVGGRITDVDGKDIDLSVGRRMTGNHGFVAAPRNLHHVVLQAVRDVLHEQGKAHLLA